MADMATARSLPAVVLDMVPAVSLTTAVVCNVASSVLPLKEKSP
jgi:hypothetical protein